VSYHDPHVVHIREEGVDLKSVPFDAKTLRGVDCVVIVTDHSGVDYASVAREAQVVVDTRHVLPRGEPTK